MRRLRKKTVGPRANKLVPWRARASASQAVAAIADLGTPAPTPGHPVTPAGGQSPLAALKTVLAAHRTSVAAGVATRKGKGLLKAMKKLAVIKQLARAASKSKGGAGLAAKKKAGKKGCAAPAAKKKDCAAPAAKKEACTKPIRRKYNSVRDVEAFAKNKELAKPMARKNFISRAYHAMSQFSKVIAKHRKMGRIAGSTWDKANS